MQTEEQHRQKKIEIMEKCFECYAEHGLTGTGVQMLADACGCSKSNLYSYFKNLDELIIESTAYCMEKVEDDYMALASTDPADVMRYIKEIPYWTAKKHGKKYQRQNRQKLVIGRCKKDDANSNNYEKSPLTGNASIFASIISVGAGLIILAATRKRKER